MSKLIKISELSKLLSLVDPLTKKPLNHTLRYWEREFKVIKPKKINNRRYYTPKQVEIIKQIKFLIKNKGMTIAGAKNLIDSNTNKLDVDNKEDIAKTFDPHLLAYNDTWDKVDEMLDRIMHSFI